MATAMTIPGGPWLTTAVSCQSVTHRLPAAFLPDRLDRNIEVSHEQLQLRDLNADLPPFNRTIAPARRAQECCAIGHTALLMLPRVRQESPYFAIALYELLRLRRTHVPSPTRLI